MCKVFFCLLFVFAFYAEIQDGQQKWRENKFGENLPVDSADTLRVKKDYADNLRVKNFVKIALAHSISEINAFCVLHKNSIWLPKVVGKRFWQQLASRLCRYLLGQNFCRNRSSSLRFRDKCVIAFCREIQDGRQKWRETILVGTCQ